MIETMSRPAPGPLRTEAEMAADPDSVAGRAMVEARVARCTAAEQAAFWEAVRRCFGGPAPRPPPEPGVTLRRADKRATLSPSTR